MVKCLEISISYTKNDQKLETPPEDKAYYKFKIWEFWKLSEKFGISYFCMKHGKMFGNFHFLYQNDQIVWWNQYNHYIKLGINNIYFQTFYT